MKTFYSVKYASPYFFGARVRWFDNKKDATEFAKRDFCDLPEKHRYTRTDKIREIELIIALQD